MESAKKMHDQLRDIETEIKDLKSQKQNIINKLHDVNNNDTYYLYNILTDEMFKIECELPKLIKMMELLIFRKYFNKHNLTDEQFLSSINLLRNVYKEID